MILEIVREACERVPELESDWFAVFGYSPHPSSSNGRGRRVSSETITEAAAVVPKSRLKQARTHHEVSPSGWTLIADGRVYEDGKYQGELLRALQPRGGGGVTITFMTI